MLAIITLIILVSSCKVFFCITCAWGFALWCFSFTTVVKTFTTIFQEGDFNPQCLPPDHLMWVMGTMRVYEVFKCTSLIQAIALCDRWVLIKTCFATTLCGYSYECASLNSVVLKATMCILSLCMCTWVLCVVYCQLCMLSICRFL